MFHSSIFISFFFLFFVFFFFALVSQTKTKKKDKEKSKGILGVMCTTNDDATSNDASIMM